MEKNIPQHVAIIPDGNRRWAESRGKDPWEGHRAGAEVLQSVLEEAFRLHIPYFTFWAASEDNLAKRSKAEVQFLAMLFEEYFRKLAKEPKIHEERVRIRVIGKWDALLPDTVGYAIRTAQDATVGYDQHHLTFLVGYSGDAEMREAIEKLRNNTPTLTKSPPVTDRDIRMHLWTGLLPDVDLVIRTGGEPHWSGGFMMWLTQNSEFSFTEKLWPDFTPEDFRAAVAEYQNRRRMRGT